MTDPTPVNGHDARPMDRPSVIQPNQAAPVIPSRTQLTKTADYLQDNIRIGTFFQNHLRYRRYVNLKKTEIFNALVTHYTTIFHTHWTIFRRFVEGFTPTPGYEGNLPGFAAAVYISAWFHDLYVSNRDACRKLSDSAYIETYNQDLIHKSMEYDRFLVVLNAHIRPTNVKLTHEDTLYIPRISVTFDAFSQTKNYFNIAGWAQNDPMFYGLIQMFKDRKILQLDPLSENATGRPSWLFDWHTDNLCYAWFPTQENYNFEDVTIAFIIGEACTPKLAPRDYDEWQMFTGNIIPANIQPSAYQRVRQIAYHGAITFRIIETRQWSLDPAFLGHCDLAVAQPAQQTQTPTLPPAGPSTAGQKKQKTSKQHPTPSKYNIRSRTLVAQTGQTSTVSEQSDQSDTQEEEPEEEGEVQQNPAAQPHPTTHQGIFQNQVYTITVPPMAQFRIVDYIYHSRVVQNNDAHSRIAALRQILY